MPFAPRSRLPLRRFGPVAAGFPSPAQGYEDEPLDLNDLLIRHPAATFFFRVRGDDLLDEGIRDRSILVVDRSLTPTPAPGSPGSPGSFGPGGRGTPGSPGSLVVADRGGERVVCRLPSSRSSEDEPDLVVWGVVTAIVTRL